MRELNVSEIEQVNGGFIASAAWIVYGVYRVYRTYKVIRTISHAGSAGAIVGGLKEHNGE